jgi:uncharacterized delta-60 repeat protein
MRRATFRTLLALAILAVQVVFSPSALAAPGDLDTTFGSSGTVLTDFGSGNPDFASAVAIQEDGKIVVAGTSSGTDGGDFAVARYNVDGSLDAAFGSGGIVLTDLGSGSFDQARGVVLQQDGKIVVAGSTTADGTFDFAVARYDSDGALDPGFGSGGKVWTDLDSASTDEGRAVALQADGKIVVAGPSDSGQGRDFAVVRYQGDGDLDPAFGSGGKVQTDLGSSSDDGAYGVSIQSDGRIVTAGFTNASGGGNDFAVVRYSSNGSLDPGFGSGGAVLTGFGPSGDDVANAVVIQPGGKLVVAGVSSAAGSYGFAISRYNSDGSLDAGFGSGGTVLTAFGAGFAIGNGVAIQPDGKIVVDGFAGGGGNIFALARYNGDGSLDSGFGLGGQVTTSNGSASEAFAVAIQQDGKIVAAGDSNASGSFDFALVRYDGGPTGSDTLTITSDTELTADHEGAIVIGADNVTLNCQGHRVTGSGSGPGILVQDRSGAVIKNCRVMGFGSGIDVVASSGTRLWRNRATGNQTYGFRLTGSSSNTLVGNISDHNASSAGEGGGFLLNGASNSNVLFRNASSGNGGIGFHLSIDAGPTVDNRLDSNFACGNATSDALDENPPGTNTWHDNRFCTPLDYALVNTLGAASTGTAFNVFGANGPTIYGAGSIGPRFILTRKTVITQIGGFMNNCESIVGGVPVCPNTQPFLVEIRPALGDAPDPSKVLATLLLSHDDDPLVISFESVESHLILPPGTYFALFATQDADAGFLMGGATDPFNYLAGSTTFGFFDPTSGTALTFESFGAVRILGHDRYRH